MVHLLLVHGVGGASPADAWTTPLNDRLQYLGFPALRPSLDTITVANYGDLLDVTEAPSVSETYRAPQKEQLVAERLEYFVRQRELERYVRAHQEVGPLMGVQQFDRKAVGMIAGVAEFFHFPDVRNFVTRKTVRDAIWARILKDVPQQGHLIIIGHSLGSMVVAGLLRRLPARLIVDLVVTVGSPLQFDRYRKHLPPLTTDFPYGRVRGWLNVYASGDLVTGGRGISGSIPQAFDVSAHLNGAHDLRAYMSHASVASAIGNVAFAVRDQQPTKRSGEVARALHESWRPLLLGTTFSHQLSQLLPSKEWESHLRLEAARKEVALRAVAAIEAERATRSQLIARIQKLGIPILEDELREHPLADGRHPTFEDLTVGAARILEGTWKDQELLSMAVALMLQPIVPPFDIQAELKNRTKPLVRTLNVIRRSRGNLADDAFAEQIHASITWAESKLGDDKFPWGTVLLASGLAVLAVTGVGLAIAAPAGLVGAAVVTSTLAAFGPGGMVGGLVTLAALTGTAGSISALGFSAELQAGDDSRGSQVAAVTQSGVELAEGSLDVLHVTVTGMLAVVHAQRALGFTSTEPMVRMVLSSAHDAASAEFNTHREFAPESKGTQAWGKKYQLIGKALKALDSLTDVGVRGLHDMSAVAAALTAGKAPEELRGPTA